MHRSQFHWLSLKFIENHSFLMHVMPGTYCKKKWPLFNTIRAGYIFTWNMLRVMIRLWEIWNCNNRNNIRIQVVYEVFNYAFSIFLLIVRCLIKTSFWFFETKLQKKITKIKIMLSQTKVSRTVPRKIIPNKHYKQRVISRVCWNLGGSGAVNS